MSKKKIKEDPVKKYKGYFICRAGGRWRIKDSPEKNYAIHHGSFDSVKEAEGYIDFWLIYHDEKKIKET